MIYQVPKPEKRKRKKRKYKAPWKRQEKRLDNKYAILLKLSNGLKCECCKKTYPLYETKGGYKIPQNLHCSHWITRSRRNTRWLWENTDCLCYGCHRHFEKSKNTDYRKWKLEKHNWKQLDLDELEQYSNKKFSGDRSLIEIWIDTELKKILKDFPKLGYPELEDLYK